jgi:hypothetical protein
MGAVCRKPFDGEDRLADGDRGGNAAGPERAAIDVHRTRPALADAAAEFGARQPNQIADHPQQGRLRVRIDSMPRPIDREIKRQYFSDKPRSSRNFGIRRHDHEES